MPNAVILLAAGKGARMQGAAEDKVLARLAGLPVLCYSINAFLLSRCVSEFYLVYRDREQRQALSEALSLTELNHRKVIWVKGGAQRQDSVFNALQEIPLTVDNVFIHDCARPLVQPEAIKRLRKAVERDKAAVLAHRVVDTVKRVADEPERTERQHLEDVPRSHLWAMETPQAFECELICEAYRRLRVDNQQVTDDTAAVARLEHPITIVENDTPNPKLTYSRDLAYVEYLLQKSEG